MSKPAYNERFLSRGERRARREAVVVEFDAGSKRDADAWENGFMDTATVRPSFEALPDREYPALDALLSTYGGRRVLGALASLCDARAPSEFDMETDFSDHDENERWQDNANALFSVMEKLK